MVSLYEILQDSDFLGYPGKCGRNKLAGDFARKKRLTECLFDFLEDRNAWLNWECKRVDNNDDERGHNISDRAKNRFLFSGQSCCPSKKLRPSYVLLN